MRQAQKVANKDSIVRPGTAVSDGSVILAGAPASGIHVSCPNQRTRAGYLPTNSCQSLVEAVPRAVMILMHFRPVKEANKYRCG